MAYTYTWTDAEQTGLRREDGEGNVAFVPVAPGNRDYEAYVASGVEAVPYTEPVVVQTEEEISQLRQAAYTAEADPLYFEWQAGEGTEEVWLAKREEIRLRYPHVAVV